MIGEKSMVLYWHLNSGAVIPETTGLGPQVGFRTGVQNENLHRFPEEILASQLTKVKTTKMM